eukprot:6183084-Pleurochrysis_carterae.AAC.3
MMGKPVDVSTLTAALTSGKLFDAKIDLCEDVTVFYEYKGAPSIVYVLNKVRHGWPIKGTLLDRSYDLLMCFTET